MALKMKMILVVSAAVGICVACVHAFAATNNITLSSSLKCDDPGNWQGPVFTKQGNPVGAGVPAPPCQGGTYLASSTSIPSFAAVGINASISGDRRFLQNDQALIRMVTRFDATKQENALQLDCYVNTGVRETARPNKQIDEGDHSEKTCLYVTLAQGKGAANTWGMNIDIHVREGQDKSDTYNLENDQTNFGGPAVPGLLGGVTRTHYFDTATGYPETAFHMMAGSPQPSRLTASYVEGVPRINVTDSTGNGVSAGDGISGVDFEPFTFVVSVGGSQRGTRYLGKDVILNKPPHSSSNSDVKNAIVDEIYQSYFGFVANGNTTIRDAFIVDGTDDQYFLKSYGNHQTIMDTTESHVQYLWRAKSGQTFCFDGHTSCLTANMRTHFIDFTSPLQINTQGSRASGIALELMSNTPRAPSLIHYSDSNSYNWGVGGGQAGEFEWWNGRFPGNVGNRVATMSANGLMSAFGFKSPLMTPESSHAQCSEGQFQDDRNYHYVCVAPNHWKRTILSDF